MRALPWLIVALLTVPLQAEEPLRITVESARFQFEPAYIRLRIRVDPHRENRALTVGIVSANFETSTLEVLEGHRAPISRWREFKDVPAGEYEAISELVRSDGSTTLARATFRVIGRE